jgi:hypothetical protein
MALSGGGAGGGAESYDSGAVVVRLLGEYCVRKGVNVGTLTERGALRSFAPVANSYRTTKSRRIARWWNRRCTTQIDPVDASRGAYEARITSRAPGHPRDGWRGNGCWTRGPAEILLSMHQISVASTCHEKFQNEPGSWKHSLYLRRLVGSLDLAPRIFFFSFLCVYLRGNIVFSES